MSARDHYTLMKQELNEIQWRHFLALEALRIGHGGIHQVRTAIGADFKTIKKGIDEILSGNLYHPGERIRKVGGGRKKLSEHQPGLVTVVEKTADPKGNPENPIRWTSYSMEHIANAVNRVGFIVSPRSIYRILKSLGFAMKANKKSIEGTKNHPDRDLQFQHINSIGLKFQLQHFPIISVDCKKKELIGNFKNNGREWMPKGKERAVNVYDFKSLSEGKAVPYGVYDLLTKSGFVNVGIDHDTAVFAVESIRRWWKTFGSSTYLQAKEMLILADGGGSNGSHNRLWKSSLQKLSNETKLIIHVSHYPPYTSKWNAIEHALFSYISINWRAKPLVSLETIIEIISNTTTKAGLTVTAMADINTYRTGIKVTDKEFKKLNIVPDEFHGEWNYTIKPQTLKL